MNFPVFTTNEYLARLTALITAEYPVEVGDETMCRLFKNNVTPDANSTAASFEQADFNGYAAVKVVMQPPSMNDQGMVVSKSNLINFSTAPGEDVQTVYGVYFQSLINDRILAAQKFDTPQVMGGALPQAVSGVWRTSEPLSTLGWIDVEN
jgi:hypothetical protein